MTTTHSPQLSQDLLFVGRENVPFGDLEDYIVCSQNTTSVASGFPVSCESI